MPGGEFAVWAFEAVAAMAVVAEDVVSAAAAAAVEVVVTDVLVASMCTGKGWYG